ncbi:cytochrome P450 [Phanerochaete sordida]|uniref:Cytochrome P450 n=1 Tax=Phanerochaete sordida TaxID=48140 RepID=A0A9P3LIL6_9APHY|nr:cytochrome P450 [Phanerochaete sordida]
MTLPSILYASLAWLLPLFLLGYIIASRSQKRAPYPPGPAGLPIIGNFFDIPRDYTWVKYKEVGDQHGSDILHSQVFGQHIVVLNTANAAHDIFEKRSNIYSGRQHSVMAFELSGWGWNWAFWQYDEPWKANRKLIHKFFSQDMLPEYNVRLVHCAHDLLRALLDAPDSFRDHLAFLTGSTTLSLVYGMNMKPHDPDVELIQKAVESLTELVNADVYAVDFIPALKYLPSWLPGAGFKRQARLWKKYVEHMYTVPYRKFKEALQTGSAKPCFASLVLSAAEEEGDKCADENLMQMIGTIYGGAAETTATALSIFILAVTLFPETQIPVQQELDRELGRSRLPTLDDQEALPHVTAMVYEVLRWHAIAPLGVPHRSTADAEYNGYFIPRGSVVIGNIWAMLHDPAVYRDPEAFTPARFLTAAGTLNDTPPPAEAFGFGRRICPGRHYARDLLWLTVASVLAAFKIERAIDDNGEEVAPHAEFTPRFVSAPLPFSCRFTPRFAGAEDLIRAAAEDRS